MRLFHVFGILTSLAALFSYLNHRFLRLPVTIGLMLLSLLFSVILMTLTSVGLDAAALARQLVQGIDFNVFFLEGILSFLLFCGALFVKVEELLDVKFDIALFAVVGLLCSAALVGGGIYGISYLGGFRLPLLHCFLFGALISPTDPVAVLPMLRGLGIPERINAQIAGESLFNDGIGIVLFLSLLALTAPDGIGVTEVCYLFLRQAVGGALFGTLLGWLGYLLMKSIDEHRLEILITLALVSGGYSLASLLKVSGPLAMVMAGLLIGGRGRKLAMSENTRENLDRFWDLVEQFLNAILFTLIGLEVLVIGTSLTAVDLVVGVLALPVVLLARYLTMVLLGALLHLRTRFSLRTAWVMTWSGLRGGIPIGLALGLPQGAQRTVFLFATYLVVAFSILVQGNTLKYLVGKRERNG